MFIDKSAYAPELWPKLYEKYPEHFPEPTEEELVAQEEVTIRQKYALLMKQVIKPYSDEERETWPTQLSEALDWTVDNTVEVPLLASIASDRGIPLSLLVDKVMENNRKYRSAIGSLLGQQQKELDELYSIKGEL